jgi:integrase
MTIRQLNKLTARQAVAAKDGVHGDGGGLYLKISDGGKRRRWVFRFARDGRVTEMGLGAAGAVTLKDARIKRNEYAKQLDAGYDPLAERRRKLKEQKARVTFAEAAEAYIAQNHCGWGASSLRAWKDSLKRDCAPIAKLRLDEIAIGDVKRAIQPLVDKGLHVTARRTQSRIQALLSYSIEHGWRPEDMRSSWSSISPKRRKGEQKPHHRALDWRKLPNVLARVRQSKSVAANVVELIALTAARASEAREARWSEIDFDAKTWSIRATRTKTGQAHRIPLSNQALAILTKLKVRRLGDLVFPGDRNHRPVSPAAVWEHCDRVTDGRASPHGFRSSFRDWCGETGVPRELAERALAHSVGNAVEEAYARSDLLDRRRLVMQEWANFLDGSDAASAEIVPIRRVK